MAEQRLNAVADRLEKAVTRLESLGKGSPAGGTDVKSKAPAPAVHTPLVTQYYI